MTLQEKAVAALQARADGDERWVRLVLALMLRTSMSQQAIVARIELMAAGVPV